MFKKKNNNQTKDQLVIDTSGLMDGRIEQIISLGFLNYQILVPKFVVLELQAVADKSDKIRRDRAREALNLTNELIKSAKAELINPDVEKDEVDNMLIATSLNLNAKLYTTDYNLQKVAEIEGVTVLNPNQLIHNIKLNFTPGEFIELKLSGKGTERDQAVGYVNGVMIVVKNGIRSLGKNVEVEITNLIEGENGHIVFAEIKKPSSNQTPARSNNFKKPASQPLQTRARLAERPASRPAQKPDINRPKYSPRPPAKKDFRPKNNNQRKFVRRVSPEDKMLASIDQFGEDK
jgi:uncharacterized protein YacL